MSGDDVLVRTAVRALLVTPERRLLMLRLVQPGRRFWITPGGGIEPGESDADALRRELREELGLGAPPRATLVWTRRHAFTFRERRIDQSERYYLVPTEAFDPPRALLDETEADVVEALHWWSLDEIAASDETFVPRALAAHLAPLLDGDVPPAPVDVGI